VALTGDAVAISRRAIVILALAAILVIAGAITLASSTGSPPKSTPRSLDTKTSCVYVGGTTAGLASFAKLTGQPVNCVLVYNDSTTTWSQWADPWFTQPKYGWQPWLQTDPSDRRVVISQEMIPDQVPSNWRDLGAEGAYDHYARELATNLVAAGMGNAVIRLGHEMNGGWYQDNVGSGPAQYRAWTAYWARIVKVMRSVPGADFVFDWNISTGGRDIPFSSYYPGNDVVDVIGVDIYDSDVPGDPSDPAARWTSLENAPGGLAQIVAFARAHGKPLSFPEWGVLSADDGGLGDDPAFVSGLATVIEDNKVLYEAYFDRTSGGVMPLADAPRSLAAWEKYFGPGGVIKGRPW
jgi:Glycosyl hydrolase family 26